MFEGKTKIITPFTANPAVGLVTTKDDITAADGAKHDIMSGKAKFATETTCNVFELLASKGIPLAYIGRHGPTTFRTKICRMIPVEVVVRKIATGSYLKRHPRTPDGEVFGRALVEFFYKTSGRRLEAQELLCDDPLMAYNHEDHTWQLYLPDKPESEDGSYLGVIEHLSHVENVALAERLKTCDSIARKVFTVLEAEWRRLDGTLYDFKLEFGMLPDGSIVVADVIDCDSWRVMWKGRQLSKQVYRDGGDLGKVLEVYEIANDLTRQFGKAA